MKITIRIWILIIALILSILAIKPSFERGVIIKSIDKDSSAFKDGLRQGEIIKEINGRRISNHADYSNVLKEINFSSEGTRIDITTKKNQYILFINKTPDFIVEDVPKTRIKTGLDIQGGARALVKPEQNITDEELQDLIAISNNRFNVFGISDVKIRGISDLSGTKFMLVEVAGATPKDLQDLVSKQGKFEAKINSDTVFVGGEKDITSVCRNDASCAGITSCQPSQSGYFCSFAFTIYLSETAAKRHAEITKNIEVDHSTGGRYLKGNLTLILDDEIVDSLLISKELKGRVTTQISIQGSGFGVTQKDAEKDAREAMHRLQTILITGSLPYKLEIVKLDTISSKLGEKFVYILFLTAFIAIGSVSIIVFARYRRIKESLAVMFTSLSEIIIILGVASLIGWNLDLPSIAGILATIGTGIDQQIVILDEARRGREISLKEKMRRAILIVMSAYVTSLVSLLPLYWAGAGLFKGFAITTIIGITAGVIISRPAFADIIKKIEEKDN